NRTFDAVEIGAPAALVASAPAALDASTAPRAGRASPGGAPGGLSVAMQVVAILGVPVLVGGLAFVVLFAASCCGVAFSGCAGAGTAPRAGRASPGGAPGGLSVAMQVVAILGVPVLVGGLAFVVLFGAICCGVAFSG